MKSHVKKRNFCFDERAKWIHGINKTSTIVNNFLAVCVLKVYNNNYKLTGLSVLAVFSVGSRPKLYILPITSGISLEKSLQPSAVGSNLCLVFFGKLQSLFKMNEPCFQYEEKSFLIFCMFFAFFISSLVSYLRELKNVNSKTFQFSQWDWTSLLKCRRTYVRCTLIILQMLCQLK